MILRLQLLVIFTFSFFLVACTEDRDLDADNKTVDIRLDNAEEITLEVIQSTSLLLDARISFAKAERDFIISKFELAIQLGTLSKDSFII
jgi:hypothetical protein